MKLIWKIMFVFALFVAAGSLSSCMATRHHVMMPNGDVPDYLCSADQECPPGFFCANGGYCKSAKSVQIIDRVDPSLRGKCRSYRDCPNGYYCATSGKCISKSKFPY